MRVVVVVMALPDAGAVVVVDRDDAMSAKGLRCPHYTLVSGHYQLDQSCPVGHSQISARRGSFRL